MSKMIQIRNVPESLHRKLKARAAIEGMTLSDYLLAEMRRSAKRPSLKELRERLNKRRPISPKNPPAKAVRQERDLH
jgi:plasmid stability protein